MHANLKPSQRAAVVAAVHPVSSTAAQTSGWIDATLFHNWLALVMVGAIAATGTTNAKIEQATDAAGTGGKDVVGKAITQFTDTDDNKQALINLKQTDLDFNNGFKFIRLNITSAVAANLIAGALIGMDPRNGVASDNDAATVDEIVG